MKVLIITSGYLPGYKYGGPVRSLSALVDQLGDEISFSIVTSGSEMGESAPYSGIQQDAWSRVGNADVWYTMHRRLSLRFWRKILVDIKPDVVYLNSVMAPWSSWFLLWRKVGLLPKLPIILAPRGEFSLGALGIKSRKKQVFMRLAALLNLHRGITWQASSEAEAHDIRRELGGDPQVKVAPDLVSMSPSQQSLQRKITGHGEFVWLSRVSPMKNLVGAVRAISSVSGDASLTVYGPKEDLRHWVESEEAASSLPSNVQFAYGGELEHERVGPALSEHNFLLFPTLGENFGHVIAEALSQGLPVILSDQTPWRNLEAAGVGWDIPLDDSGRWREVLEHCIAMDDDGYQGMSARCRGYVEIWMEKHGGRQANLEMFHAVANSLRS